MKMLNFYPLSPQLTYALCYGLSIVFMKGLSLILLPFLTHNLSQNDYGQLEIITTIATVGSIVAGLGLADTLFRFCGLAQNNEERLSHASQLLKFSLILGLILACLSLFFAGNLANIIQYGITENMMRLILIMVAFEAMNAVPLGWLRMQNKVAIFCFLLCSRALIQLIFTISFIKLNYGVTGILLAGVIAALFQILLLIYFVKDEIFIQKSRPNFKPYLRYSAPIMYSGLVAFCLFGADKWILSLFASLDSIALLGVASKIALTCVILLQPFTMWWSPKRFEIYKKGGIEKLTYYTTIGIAFAFIAGCTISMLSPLIFKFLLPNNYLEAKTLIPPLILAMICKELTELLNIGCFVGKSSHTQAILNTISAVLTLIILYVATWLYQVNGLVWGLFFGQFTRLIMFYIASNRVVKLPYKIKNILIIAIFSLCEIVLLPLTLSPINQVIVSTIMVCIITIYTFYYLVRKNQQLLKHAYAC
ncbi:lipopolysaccharide biosynthesis protein [Algibacillus agarilyticus]|uniref:lipopolysaccharide biosynthesis protein n=1 Tax=Algibacillus agarilyticus TaxID=2234133 RepID=UPI000DD0B9BF|nr:lipopolysaccharide biosynthesis protein [Algibacillus agarilyticus]